MIELNAALTDIHVKDRSAITQVHQLHKDPAYTSIAKGHSKTSLLIISDKTDLFYIQIFCNVIIINEKWKFVKSFFKKNKQISETVIFNITYTNDLSIFHYNFL